MREHDVPYHVRFAIDTDVRCGHWFTCKAKVGAGLFRARRRPLLGVVMTMCLALSCGMSDPQVDCDCWLLAVQCSSAAVASRTPRHALSLCREARSHWSAAPTCCSAPSLTSAPLTSVGGHPVAWGACLGCLLNIS